MKNMGFVHQMLSTITEMQPDIMLRGMGEALKAKTPLRAMFLLLATGDELHFERMWVDTGLTGLRESIHLSKTQAEALHRWHKAGTCLQGAGAADAAPAGLEELVQRINAYLHESLASFLFFALPGGHILVLVATGEKGFTAEHQRLCVLASELYTLGDRLMRERTQTSELRRHLERERELMHRVFGLQEDFVTISSEFSGIVALAQQLAKVSQPVLIHGELGVGKSLIAQFIHNNSSRRAGLFVRLDCHTLTDRPDDLGWQDNVLAAHEGTLFLSELSALPVTIQQAVLTLMKSKRFVVRGKEHILDVRIIASSRKPLDAQMGKGLFLEELGLRLGVFALAVPPLRERKADMPELIRQCLQRSARRLKCKVPDVDAQVMAALMEYTWSGNVFELNVMTMQALFLWSQAGQADAPLSMYFFSRAGLPE